MMLGYPLRKIPKGYKMAYEGDSIDLGYADEYPTGRVGHQVAHTLTTGSTQEPCICRSDSRLRVTEVARYHNKADTRQHLGNKHLVMNIEEEGPRAF